MTSRLPQLVVVCGLFALTAIFVWAHFTAETQGEDPLRPDRGPSSTWRGVVTGDSGPLAGIEVELREGSVTVAQGRTGDDGAWSLDWRPVTTIDPKRLRLRAVDPRGRYAVTIARPTETFAMRSATEVYGIVVSPDGDPWSGARVVVASEGEVYGETRSDGEGEFSIAGLPMGQELVVLVEGEALAPRVFRGFRVPDRLVLHMETGRLVEVRVRDPAGNPVEGATVAAAVSEEFEPSATDASDGAVRLLAATRASGFVVARAAGHLPVFLDAPIEGRAEAVLWPAREVTLKVWDSMRRRGVWGLEAEVSLADERWYGPDHTRSSRVFPLRMGPRRGEYTITLPRTPLSLRISAPGYGDEEFDLDGAVLEHVVRMRPLRQAPSATLRVRTEPLEDPLWLVVDAPEAAWFGAFVLDDGEGEITVPAGKALEIASALGASGRFLPLHRIAPIGNGRERTVRLGLSDASELIVRTEPATPSVIEIEDPVYGKAVPKQRASAPDGTARFWVRPKREARVTVHPEGNWLRHGDLLPVEGKRREWTAYLQGGAGLRFRLQDARGHPIPFAEVRAWQPALAGRLDLYSMPSRVLSDAAGYVELLGWRYGPMPLEIRAEGFRLHRPPTTTLQDLQVLDLGSIDLEAAGRYAGEVVDGEGRPLAGVKLWTVNVRLRRLELEGGGSREVYDLMDEHEVETLSDPRGRFELRDTTARRPLLVAQHPGHALYAATIEQTGGDLRIRIPDAGQVRMALEGILEGIYVLLPDSTAALRVYAPGAIRLNPVQITLPVGEVELLVHYRSGKWRAARFDVKPGEQFIEMPK
ncbi:MAG: carboxypeptidase-like regulatory domain-containing protein [Planctomycetota bacterium]